MLLRCDVLYGSFINIATWLSGVNCYMFFPNRILYSIPGLSGISGYICVVTSHDAGVNCYMDVRLQVSLQSTVNG